MKCAGLIVLMVVSTINGWPTEEDPEEPLHVVRPRNGPGSSFRPANEGPQRTGQSHYGQLEYYNDGNEYFDKFYAQNEAKSHRSQNSEHFQNSRLEGHRSREPQNKEFGPIHSFNEDHIQVPSDALRGNIQLEQDGRSNDNRNHLENQSGSSRVNNLKPTSGFQSPNKGKDGYSQQHADDQFLHHGVGSAFIDSNPAIKSSLDHESAHRSAYNSKDTELNQHAFVKSNVLNLITHQVPHYIENERTRPIVYYNQNPSGPASTFQRPKTFSNPLLRSGKPNFENEFIENEPENYVRETKKFAAIHRSTGPSQPSLKIYRNIGGFTNDGSIISSKNKQGKDFERNTKEYIHKALKEASEAQKYAKDIADKLSALTNSIHKDLHKVNVVEFADNSNSEHKKVQVVDYATETGHQNGVHGFQRPIYYLPHGKFPNVNDEHADKVKVVENAVNKDEDKVKVVQVANDSGNQDDGEKVKFVNNASNTKVDVHSSAGNPSIQGNGGIWNQGNSHLLRYNHHSNEPVFHPPTYYLPSGKFTNNPRYKDFYPSVITKPNYGPFLDYPVHVRKVYIPHRIGGNVNVVENADNSQNLGKPINKDDDKVKVVETADNSKNIPNGNDENADKVKVVENAANTNDQDKVKVANLPNDSGKQNNGEKVKFVNNNNTGDESNNGNNGVNVVESPANNPIIQDILHQGNDNSHLLRYNHQSNEPIFQKPYNPYGKFVNNPRYKDFYPTVATKPNISPNVDYPIQVRGIPRIVNTDANDGASGFMTSPSNVNKDSEYPDSVKNNYKSRPSYNGFSLYRNGKNDVKNGPVISNSYYRNPPNYLPNQAVNGPTTIVGGPATGFQVPDISPVFADVIQLPDGTYIPGDGNNANLSKGNNAPESKGIVKPVEEKLPQEILPSVVNKTDLENGVPSSSPENKNITGVIEDSKQDQNPATIAAENNKPAANEVPNVVAPTTILGDSPTVTGFQVPDISPVFADVIQLPDVGGPATGFQVPDISPVFADVIQLPDGTYIPGDGNNANLPKGNNAPESKGIVKPVEEKLPQEILPSVVNKTDLENGVPSSSPENKNITGVIEDSKQDQNPATIAAENNKPAANEVPNVVAPTTILGDSPTVTGFQVPDISPVFADVIQLPDVGGPATGFQVPDISPVFADVIQLPDGTYIPGDGNNANLSKGNNAPESKGIVKPVEEKLPQEILPSVVTKTDLENGVPSSSPENKNITGVIEDSKQDQNPATIAAENNKPAANEVPNVVAPTTILGDSPTVTGFQLPDISPTFVDVLVQPDGTLISRQENNSSSTNDDKASVSKGNLENSPAANENLVNKIVSSSTQENDEANKEQGLIRISKDKKDSKNTDRVKHKRSKRKHRRGAKKSKKSNDVNNVDEIEATKPNTETDLTKNDAPSKTNDNTKIIEDREVKVSEEQQQDKKHKRKHSKVFNDGTTKKKHSKRNKEIVKTKNDDEDNKNNETTIIKSIETEEKSDKIDHPSEKNKDAQENNTNRENIKKDVDPTGGEKDNKFKRKHGKRSKSEKSSTKRRRSKDKKSKKHENSQNIDVTNKKDQEDTKTIVNNQESSNNQQDQTIKKIDDTVASSSTSNPKEDTTIDVNDKTEKDVGTTENSSATTNDDKAEDNKNDEQSVNKNTEEKKPSDVIAEETKGDENEVTSDDRSTTENTEDSKDNDKDTKSDSTKGNNENVKDLPQSQIKRKLTRYYKLHLPKRNKVSKTQSTTEKDKTAKISQSDSRKSDEEESIPNLPTNSDNDEKSHRTEPTETVDENETELN